MADLAENIRKFGLLHQIVLYDGKVLDGRNRLRACELAGVEPRFRNWSPDGQTPTEYVISVNEMRRHLTQSQKAAAAAMAVPLLEEEARKRQGRRTDIVTSLPIGNEVTGRSVDIAAERFGTSRQQVVRANKLRKKAPEVFEQVRHGEKTVWAGVIEAGLEGPSVKAKKPPAPPEKKNGRLHPKINPETGHGLARAKSQKERFFYGVGALVGTCRGLGELQVEAIAAVSTTAELEEQRTLITNCIAALKRIQTSLSEATIPQ